MATLSVSALSSSETDAGVLTINRNVGPALDCAGYTEVSDGDTVILLPAMAGGSSA